MPGGQTAAQQWAAAKTKSVTLFRALMAHGKAANCDLPARITGFVEGEHMNVLLKALQDGQLRAVGSMIPGCVRDSDKPGADYVYFRVMLSGENARTMAFGSVGSSRMVYKSRMVFDRRIWIGKQGGYVCDRDGMGQVNATPFSQEAQRTAFSAIIGLDKTARGNAEVGIYDSVSMSDLRSAWCVFPFSVARIDRELAAHPELAQTAEERVLSSATDIRGAVQNYLVLKHYLTTVVDKGPVGDSTRNRWLRFSR